MDRAPSKNENSLWIKAGWIFLFVFAVTDFFSISIAQISVTLASICWIGQWISSGEKPDFSPLKWPFILFVVASIAAALLSLDVGESIRDSKDLLHIVIFFAAYDFFRRDIGKSGLLFRFMAAAGGLIATVGIIQIAMKGLEIHNRITGFQDIWMTYAGLLMLAITLASGVMIFTFNKWRDLWLFPALALMLAAVTLSLTRNAWVGALVGLSAIAVMKKPTSLLIIPLLSGLVFVASPPGVQDRIASIVDLDNKSNRERLLLWEAGIKIWSDYPVFGVGQNSFPIVYPKYRHPDVAEPNISHLHNNFLELVVERGLFGLLAWMSIWLTGLWFMIRGYINRGDDKNIEMTIASSTGFALAFLTAGLFEYNFGDSEIQMLFYLVLAAGMAAVKNVYNKRGPKNNNNLS